MNERIWIWLGDSFSFVGEKGLAAAVVLVFFIAFAIFALGMTIEWIRKKAAKLLGIPQISKEIVRAIEGAMKRLFFALK